MDTSAAAGMQQAPFETLLLDHQLCFRLYVASKEITRRYHPYLSPIGLTYTQYITMMVLWVGKRMSMKELGERLNLESSTLTPLVKKLEAAGYVARERSTADERSTIVALTAKGRALRKRAASVPTCMAGDLGLDPKFTKKLAGELDRLIDQLHSQKTQ